MMSKQFRYLYIIIYHVMDEWFIALVKLTHVSSTQIMQWRHSVARWDGGMSSDLINLQGINVHTSTVHSS